MKASDISELIKMKKTYDYEVKKRYREKIKSFVNIIIPKLKNRKWLKILTLLGHEDLELEQVWDPLDVPRKNITNVERDKKVIEKSSKNRGVNDVYGDLEEVIKTVDGPFNVIHLDMQSPFTTNQRDVLRQISGRQLLGERGILITNYLGQREGGYNKLWFLMYKNGGVSDTQPLEEQLAPKQVYPKEDITGRSDLVSKMINMAMLNGITNIKKHYCAEKLGCYNKLLEEMLEVYEKYSASKESIEELKAHLHSSAGSKIIKEAILDMLEKSGDKFLINLKHTLKQLIYYQKIGSYFSVQQKRYRYVGDNGSPMLTDINYFKHLPMESVFELVADDYGIRIIDNRNVLAYQDQKKIVKQFEGAMGKVLSDSDSLEPREFLGSSYKSKPIKRKSRIKKQDVIYLLKEGIPAEEILETYSGFTKMQLAAFKAHLTMGTYETFKNQ